MLSSRDRDETVAAGASVLTRFRRSVTVPKVVQSLTHAVSTEAECSRGTGRLPRLARVLVTHPHRHIPASKGIFLFRVRRSAKGVLYLNVTEVLLMIKLSDYGKKIYRFFQFNHALSKPLRRDHCAPGWRAQGVRPTASGSWPEHACCLGEQGWAGPPPVWGCCCFLDCFWQLSGRAPAGKLSVPQLRTQT